MADSETGISSEQEDDALGFDDNEFKKLNMSQIGSLGMALVTVIAHLDTIYRRVKILEDEIKDFLADEQKSIEETKKMIERHLSIMVVHQKNFEIKAASYFKWATSAFPNLHKGKVAVVPKPSVLTEYLLSCECKNDFRPVTKGVANILAAMKNNWQRFKTLERDFVSPRKSELQHEDRRSELKTARMRHRNRR